MFNEQQLIFALDKLKAEMALEGVSTKGDENPAYQHGLNVGTSRGIELAKKRLMSLLTGDQEDNVRKSKARGTPYSA